MTQLMPNPSPVAQALLPVLLGFSLFFNAALAFKPASSLPLLSVLCVLSALSVNFSLSCFNLSRSTN